MAGFGCLLVLVAAAPQSWRWMWLSFWGAGICCLARLLLGEKLRRASFFTPLLIFFALAGVSTFVSYVPLSSWQRFYSYSLLMLAVIVPQTVRTKRQAKAVVAVLLASAFISAARTGWQYAFGIGTRITFQTTDPKIRQAGLLSGFMIQSIEGHNTRTPADWQRALNAIHSHSVSSGTLQLVVAQETVPPLVRFWTRIDRQAFERLLADPNTKIARARPSRAQGHFGHYIPYAGILTVLSLLSWGLLLTSVGTQKRVVPVILGIVFLALMASLVATEI